MNQKAGTRARRFSETGLPRRSAKAPPEPSKLLLLGFLCLLGLLRCLFLRFLSHSILLGLMDGNATPRHARRRASLALSSKSIPTDSLAPAPRCHGPVITLSTAVLGFGAFFAALPSLRAKRSNSES